MSKEDSENFLPFALPSIEEEEISAVVSTLRTGWLTTGPKTREFEARFAEYVGARHAIAVNSATAGLHLSLEALGIGPGDKVITTPFTFTATAEVVRYLGADPIFVDIEEESKNIDPARVDAVLRKNGLVKAILPVHFAGKAANLSALEISAERYGIPIVEDAAHAFPATHRGRMIGSISAASIFSFYATKTISTGEGGMITTDIDELANRARTMRLHGISRDVFDRYTTSQPSWYYEVVAPGFKYNMTDVAAAIGIEQLQKAEAFRERREQIARFYDRELDGLPVIKPVFGEDDDQHAWHLYTIRIDSARSPVNRDKFIEQMSELGIGTSVHFIPLHLQPYWRDRYKLLPQQFPVSTAVFEGIVSLPIYPRMTQADCERVVTAIRTVLNSGRQGQN